MNLRSDLYMSVSIYFSHFLKILKVLLTIFAINCYLVVLALMSRYSYGERIWFLNDQQL